MNKLFLLLGSNMGDSPAIFETAKLKIETFIGNINKCSSLYATAAWGNEDQPDFLNQILIVDTKLSAIQILPLVLDIEKQIGRVRTYKNAPRVIDIDIIFFNNEIIQTKNLMIPHPEIANRRFVLTPLCEIAPSHVHPVHKKTVKNLLLHCLDMLNVQKI